MNEMIISEKRDHVIEGEWGVVYDVVGVGEI